MAYEIEYEKICKIRNNTKNIRKRKRPYEIHTKQKNSIRKTYETKIRVYESLQNTYEIKRRKYETIRNKIRNNTKCEKLKKITKLIRKTIRN